MAKETKVTQATKEEETRRISRDARGRTCN